MAANRGWMSSGRGFLLLRQIRNQRILLQEANPVPAGWYGNLADTVVALKRALTAAVRPDLAFPNHDTEIMQGKRVARVIQWMPVRPSDSLLISPC